MRLAGAITLYAEGVGFLKPKFGGHSAHHGVKKHGVGKWHHLKNHAVKSPTQAAWSSNFENDQEGKMGTALKADEDASEETKRKKRRMKKLRERTGKK